MSDRIGPLAVIPENGQVTLPGAPEVSPDTAKLVDNEVKQLRRTSRRNRSIALEVASARFDLVVRQLEPPRHLVDMRELKAAGLLASRQQHGNLPPA